MSIPDWENLACSAREERNKEEEALPSPWQIWTEQQFFVRTLKNGRAMGLEPAASCVTVSGHKYLQHLLAMWVVCGWTLSHHISIHTLKYALATLIQGVASALRHELLEHASHGFYSIHQMIQLRKLSLGERSPAFRRASGIAETKEQISDFTQCKTELTRTLNDCQAVKRSVVVSPLPVHSRGPGKQSNSLVIANRRCLESNLSRHLGNRQFGHKDILD
jgi:hypothetical protein